MSVAFALLFFALALSTAVAATIGGLWLAGIDPQRVRWAVYPLVWGAIAAPLLCAAAMAAQRWIR